MIEIAAGEWAGEIGRCKGTGLTYFDFLTAIDGPTGLRVVVRLSRPDGAGAVLLATRPEGPLVPTVVGVYAGAAWHERETAEMFGIVFVGHPSLDRLLLPPDFVGYPLRKDFELATRAVGPWPGGAQVGGARRAAPAGIPVGWAGADG